MKFYKFADPSSVVLQKRSWSDLNFSGQHYENIFQALHKNFNCLSPLFCTWMDHASEPIRTTVVDTPYRGGVLCLMWWIRHTEAGYYANGGGA